MSRVGAVIGARLPGRRTASGPALLDLSAESTGAYLAPGLIAVTLLLTGFGLLSVYSASSFTAQSEGLPDSYYLLQQASRALVGIAALLAASYVDYRVYRYLAWPLLAVTTALLVVVILGLGKMGIVAHPVGQKRNHPGNALQPDIIGAAHADIPAFLG